MFLENSSINALLLKRERQKGMQVLLDANCCHLMSVKGMHLGLGKKKSNSPETTPSNFTPENETVSEKHKQTYLLSFNHTILISLKHLE